MPRAYYHQVVHRYYTVVSALAAASVFMPKSVANTKAIKPKGAMMASQSDLVQIAASNEEQSLVVLRPKPEAIRAAQAGEIVPGASGRKHRY